MGTNNGSRTKMMTNVNCTACAAAGATRVARIEPNERPSAVLAPQTICGQICTSSGDSGAADNLLTDSLGLDSVAADNLRTDFYFIR